MKFYPVLNQKNVDQYTLHSAQSSLWTTRALSNAFDTNSKDSRIFTTMSNALTQDDYADHVELRTFITIEATVSYNLL